MNGVIDGDAETPAAVTDGCSWSRHESRYYPEEVISRFGGACRCMVRGAGTDRRAVRWRLEEDWSDTFRPPQMQKPPPVWAGVSGLGSLTITYFHTGIRTIIGVESFHG
ncbi:hypothetical protein, partial [Burkholderia multivorans]|uniref:hypothetical protein n=2 Tax=Burkholderia multivorans TaxID=87883 RepID=UPI001C614ED6